MGADLIFHASILPSTGQAGHGTGKSRSTSHGSVTMFLLVSAGIESVLMRVHAFGVIIKEMQMP